MKLIIDKEIQLTLDSPKDQLDIADYFEDKGIKFSHSWSFWLLIEEQEISLSTVHMEDFLDVLDKYFVNISLEREQRGIYFLRTN